PPAFEHSKLGNPKRSSTLHEVIHVGCHRTVGPSGQPPRRPLRLAGETPRILLSRDSLIYLLAALLTALLVYLDHIFTLKICAFYRLLYIALRLHHLLHWIVDIFPTLSRSPRPLTLVPWPARAAPIGHIVVGMGIARITFQYTWREVWLNGIQGSSEHLHMSNFTSHQKIETLVDIWIFGKLHQVF